MIRRLICLLRRHQGPRHRRPVRRHEWVSRGRVVWMTTCFHCGVQLDEGNSDSWIIPDWIARDLMHNATASMDSIVRAVLRG